MIFYLLWNVECWWYLSSGDPWIIGLASEFSEIIWLRPPTEVIIQHQLKKWSFCASLINLNFILKYWYSFEHNPNSFSELQTWGTLQLHSFQLESNLNPETDDDVESCGRPSPVKLSVRNRSVLICSKSVLHFVALDRSSLARLSLCLTSKGCCRSSEARKIVAYNLRNLSATNKCFYESIFRSIAFEHWVSIAVDNIMNVTVCAISFYYLLHVLLFLAYVARLDHSLPLYYLSTGEEDHPDWCTCISTVYKSKYLIFQMIFGQLNHIFKWRKWSTYSIHIFLCASSSSIHGDKTNIRGTVIQQFNGCVAVMTDHHRDPTRPPTSLPKRCDRKLFEHYSRCSLGSRRCCHAPIFTLCHYLTKVLNIMNTLWPWPWIEWHPPPPCLYCSQLAYDRLCAKRSHQLAEERSFDLYGGIRRTHCLPCPFFVCSIPQQGNCQPMFAYIWRDRSIHIKTVLVLLSRPRIPVIITSITPPRSCVKLAIHVMANDDCGKFSHRTMVDTIFVINSRV